MASEKRLIDAVVLENRIYESKEHNPHMDFLTSRNHHYEHDHFLKMVRSSPTVDAVEVVRCKDCEFFSKTLGCVISEGMFSPTPMDFCSCGKKKGGTGNGI